MTQELIGNESPKEEIQTFVCKACEEQTVVEEYDKLESMNKYSKWEIQQGLLLQVLLSVLWTLEVKMVFPSGN